MILARTALLGLGSVLLSGCLIETQPEPAPPKPSPSLTGPDTCGSGAVEPYIDGSVDLIPSELLRQPARVYPTGSMLTMDYRIDRINVEYDPDTRTVVRVKCG